MRTYDAKTWWVCAAMVSAVTVSPARGQSDVAFPPHVYVARRARLVEQLGPHPIVVPGRDLIRNGGHDRQHPNFWYLTGVESPYAILVIVPGGDARRGREVLFVPDEFQFAGAQYPHPDARFRRAAWNHPIRRLSPGGAAEVATGIADVAPIDTFAERLRALVADADTVYIVRSGQQRYLPPGLGDGTRTGDAQLEDAIARAVAPRATADATPAVERLRLVKDEFELAALRRASEISAIGLRELMPRIRPGMNDLEASAWMEYVWQREGSPRPAFGKIVSSGPAAMSLYTLKSENYNNTDRIMQAGELLYIDYGAAEFDTYASDLSRVYPVNGRFTPEQRRYYEIALEAQDSALAAIRPGVMMLDVIRAAARVFQRHGLEAYEDIDRMGVDRVWGVMPSPTYWLTQNGGLTDYSGARGTGVRDLGHHIGLEATDSRDYSMPLQPGMVFTVEPKLYIPELEITIMIEDVIAVTEDGYENMSAAAPKRVEEIERLMRSPR